MSRLHTALDLALRGDWRTFGRQVRQHWRTRTIRRARGAPFIYRLGGFRFVCFPDRPESAELFVNRCLDGNEIQMLQAWLGDGDTMIDLGANYGVYACAAAERLGRNGAVLAVEADPALARGLAATATLLGHESIRIACVAVSDSDGEATFHVAAPGSPTGGQSLHLDSTMAQGFIPRLTSCLSLRTLVDRDPDFATPAVVKVDIEGSDAAALRGAPAAWFGPAGPLWIVEINPTALALAGAEPEDVLQHFPIGPFACILVPHYPRVGPAPLPPRRLADDERFADASFYNLVAVPCAPQHAPRRRRLEAMLPGLPALAPAPT